MTHIDESLVAAVHGAHGETSASCGSGFCAVLHAIKGYGPAALLKAFNPAANIASNFADLNTISDAREAACIKAETPKERCGPPSIDQLYRHSYIW